MSNVPEAPRPLREIIQDAGGPSAISKASGGAITVDAVYKWSQIGIPDRHWPVVMPLAKASAAEMLAANIAVRSHERVAS